MSDPGQISLWISIASPLVVAAATWGGMRAELKHLNTRVSQLEKMLADTLAHALTRDN